MNDMGVALELLGIGMVTVFTILALVVILGNLIIRFVNRFIPEIEKVSARAGQTVSYEISQKKMAVIVSAVNKLTKGTGRVNKIEKL
ncbi:MAG: OadG family protein [Prolixibacteraceae bacterium]|nr:OadG family protein [Prolixibacteraceae bacterium]